VLLDEERYARLQAEAERRRVSVAVVVRDAVDASCRSMPTPVGEQARRSWPPSRCRSRMSES
jgi:hypothetical protein